MPLYVEEIPSFGCSLSELFLIIQFRWVSQAHGIGRNVGGCRVMDRRFGPGS